MVSDKPTKEGEKNQLKLKGICSECKKPQRELRKGSITAWIFSVGACTCKNTNLPVLKTVEEASVVSESSAAAAMQRALRGEETKGEVSPGAGDASGNGSAADVVSNVNSKDSNHKPGFPNLGERYEVLEQVGVGGMGAVYKIRDKELGKTFVAKLLRDELAKDQEAVKRFKQEADAAARLTHANLGTVYHHGQTNDGAPYLVMDFIEGKNLAELISTEILDKGRILDILSQICEGLEHAHSKGVIHRDLKPSNIIISKSPDGNDLVHLVDFGIAKVLSRPGETLTALTQTGDIFGSPLYMSPEQCSGGKIDERSDIYSLGCVMFEMFQGHPPFTGKNPFLVMMQQVNDIAPNALKAGATMSGIIECCLNKEPEYRYKCVNHIYLDLIAVANGKFPRFVQQHPRKLAPKTPPPVASYSLASENLDNINWKTQVTVIGSVLALFVCMVGLNYMQPAPQRPADPKEKIEIKSLQNGISDGIAKYLKNREWGKAIPLLELQVANARSEKDEDTLAVYLEWMGECYYETGDLFNATKCFRECLEIFASTKTQSNSHYDACIGYAKVLKKEQKYGEAALYEKKAKSLTGTVLSPSPIQ